MVLGKLISRSGRIRKIRDVSKNLISEEKNPDLIPQSETIPKDFTTNQAKKESSNRIMEKKSKINSTDLLQNALNESVESWFDKDKTFDKKKKKSCIPQVILKDDIVIFEGTEATVQNKEKPVDEVQKKENLENQDKKGVEDVTDGSKETKIAEKVMDNDQKPKKTMVNGKKGKSNRLVMGYQKKRRRVGNVVLKNYGQKIDFSAIGPEEENIIISKAAEIKDKPKEQKKSELPETKEFSLKLTDVKNLPRDSPIFSAINNIDNLLGIKTKKELKRSRSEEIQSQTPEVKSSRKSAEMPESLPSREKSKKKEIVEFNKVQKNEIKNLSKKNEKEEMEKKEEEEASEEVVKPEKEEKKKKEEASEGAVTLKIEEKEKEEEASEQAVKLKKDEKEKEVSELVFDQKEPVEEKTSEKKLFRPKGSKGRPSKKKKKLFTTIKKPIIQIPGARKQGRPRKIPTQDLSQNESETAENVKEKKTKKLSETEKKGDENQERRKSHREIKLTPKLVEMISTSGYKRGRKSSEEGPLSPTYKDGTSSRNHLEYSHLIKKATETHQSTPVPEQSRLTESIPIAPNVDSLENYLQSKMDANASSFESSWEPGDLVWARFAGNPFWPGLIIKDPFSNDEYSKIKYLGRLPRPFVHVQFLADFGRRAWGPELYLMSFNGLEEFEKIKSDLPEVNSMTPRKDLVYQQAFFTPKKMEKQWMEAIKEGENLIKKSKDERITYMMIKYPLVKYAESVANGRLVPNERTKPGENKLPQKYKRKKNLSSSLPPSRDSADWVNNKDEAFECVNTSDMEEKEDSPKITLKLMRSPKKGSKRKLNKSIAEVDRKISKKLKKEALEEDYVPSDSGSNGEKGPEVTTSKARKSILFKGAKSEKVCQICFEILENEKTVKCKGICQGLFHKSCAEKMSADLPPLEEGATPVAKKKGRKKLFVDEEGEKQADSDEKDWRCSDCSRGVNPCFVCKSRSGNRMRCCTALCGKFYHQKCLKLYPQTIYNQGAPIKMSQCLQRSKATESESPHYQILSCPAHVCHTCVSDNPADCSSKYLFEKLVKCIKCPRAYHGGNYCVPAGSTILNTTQIICANHGDPKKKSHVNISWCFICNMGGSLICCDWCPSSFHLDCLNIKPPDESYICEECESGRFPLYGEVVWAKLGRYRWWPAKILFPQEIPSNILGLPHKPWEFAVRFYGTNDYYWLNRGRVFLFQEDDYDQKFKGHTNVDKIYQRGLEGATKDYFAIKEERKLKLMETANSAAAKPPPYIKIKSNKTVGKVQLVSNTGTEPQTCDCDPNAEDPCSPNSDCLNRMLLVECDPNFCNAGTRCGNQSFEKREYPPLEAYRTEKRGWGLKSSVDIFKGTFVIEYVGEVVDDEEFKRRMKRKQETKDNNYYFLTVDKDRIIDAGPKGNLARFMNHSCFPNCETQKWTVNGYTRVGLFALRDIPAGTELTFNYNLDCVGNEKKVCHCEEENCSGFIGVKVKNDKYEKKSVKRLEKESEDECFVCSDGGELMVCDMPNCPKVYHLECVNLKEWPNETWFCPRHRCRICDRTTKRCCRECPTSYCYNHLDNNIFTDNKGDLLCSKHNTCSVKQIQPQRKGSYVNRNTPVVEYEKPFAEKYRPPLSKDRTSPAEKKNEILMEPNLTDNTPIVVENPLLSSGDGVSVQVFYVDEEGKIVSLDEAATADAVEAIDSIVEAEDEPKPMKKKKRTNIPRKKLNLPPPSAETSDETDGKDKGSSQGGIESLMIKSVEDKILDSKLSMDNIYNIIGGRNGEGSDGVVENGSSEAEGDAKPEAANKKEDLEVDRSRRSKYFKIITPEKFIKVSESETKQKKVTDFNYIEFMHPLRTARNKSKTEEAQQK